MQRRTVLKGIGGTVALSALGGRTFATQESYDPLGKVEIQGSKEAVVGPDGEVAYVAATDGFAAVDVSDPEEPTVLAERRNLLADRDDGHLQDIYDVKVEGDRLVVAGPANGKRGEAVYGFLLFDVSDPEDPEQVAFHETEHAIHNAFFEDDIVYLTGIDFRTNPVVMVDVEGDDPTEIARWSPLEAKPEWEEVPPLYRVIHDIWVQDDTAYLAYWDAGTWVIDVGDRDNPKFEAHIGGVPREELASIPEDERMFEYIEPPGNAHYVTVNDDASLLGVGAEAWDRLETAEKGGPGGIDLWNIEDLDSPEKVATIEPEPVSDATMGGIWTTSHNFDLVGDRLYSSWYQGGVKVHDVSDPTEPKQLAWWREPEETAFWTAKLADGFFVASSENEETGELYTFPDRAGTQSNPPVLDYEAQNATSTATETEETTEQTPEPTTTEPTETETPTRTPTTTEREVTETTTTNEAGQPGFDAVAALGGLALGAWRYLGRGE